MVQLRLPEDLLIGVASSALQTEEEPGGRRSAWVQYGKRNQARLVQRAARLKGRIRFGMARIPDWSLLADDLLSPKNYVADEANRAYSEWRKPIELAAYLNQQVYRFSISWQRIMPTNGCADLLAVEHYEEVVQYIKELGMQAWITIWHFDEPPWLTDLGGWEFEGVQTAFGQYVEAILPILVQADHITILNEPNGYAFMTRLLGAWPPNRRLSLRRHRHVRQKFVHVHRQTYDKLKSAGCTAPLSSSINQVCFEPAKSRGAPVSSFVCRLANRWYNHHFLRQIEDKLDELDIQYYLHMRIKWGLAICNDNIRLSDVGWELYPAGLFWLLQDANQYGLPINLTEFGLADAKDQHRPWYQARILAEVLRAREAGVPIKAVVQWTIADNYEWGDIGYAGKFGLVAVERQGPDLGYVPRPSAYKWAGFARDRTVEVD